MKKGNLIVSLIIILLINIGIFAIVDDYNAAFWINYGAVMLAFLVAAGYTSFNNSQEKLMAKLNISATIGAYLLSEIIAGLICSAFADLNPAIVLVLHLFIICAFILIFYSTLSMNSFVKQQQEQRGQELYSFKSAIERIKSIQRKTAYTAPYIKEINKACDSISSGQTSSNAEAEIYEKKIFAKLDILDEAVEKNDEVLIVSTCNELIRLSTERDSIIKLRTNF